MHLVDAAHTAAALPFPALIEALRQRFAAGAEVPQRLVLQPDAAMTSLLMPAWAEGFYAVKIVNIAPGNAARGLAGLHSTVLLHEAATGRPLALIDGDTVTARRTAAWAAGSSSATRPAPSTSRCCASSRAR